MRGMSCTQTVSFHANARLRWRGHEDLRNKAQPVDHHSCHTGDDLLPCNTSAMETTSIISQYASFPPYLPAPPEDLVCRCRCLGVLRLGRVTGSTARLRISVVSSTSCSQRLLFVLQSATVTSDRVHCGRPTAAHLISLAVTVDPRLSPAQQGVRLVAMCFRIQGMLARPRSVTLKPAPVSITLLRNRRHEVDVQVSLG